ncbi:hypothetical protein SAMN04490184_1080 [Pseudomonas extremorientalis]|uniref:Uncharacterized protein n=1 Tax=Pseudomonas extremorientalis TaxID=169669 RepID=A0ABY0RZE6_9PSED|nr:hypothetical protein SAMN04490184_1080 [Pseudomonas extremorientalis]
MFGDLVFQGFPGRLKRYWRFFGGRGGWFLVGCWFSRLVTCYGFNRFTCAVGGAGSGHTGDGTDSDCFASANQGGNDCSKKWKHR